jgi:hypothetical protein
MKYTFTFLSNLITSLRHFASFPPAEAKVKEAPMLSSTLAVKSNSFSVSVYSTFEFGKYCLTIPSTLVAFEDTTCEDTTFEDVTFEDSDDAIDDVFVAVELLVAPLPQAVIAKHIAVAIKKQITFFINISPLNIDIYNIFQQTTTINPLFPISLQNLSSCPKFVP